VLNLLSFLIIFPFLAALLLLFIKNNNLRKPVVVGSSAVIIIASLGLLLFRGAVNSQFFSAENYLFDHAIFFLEWLIALVLFYLSVKHRKFLVFGLVVLQTIFMTYFEMKYGMSVKAEHNLFIDGFSLVMALIIGVVGTLICIHALGYMREFHEHHPEFKDRRPFFFFVLFAFLSAMFGIVFANNLLWLFFFWEITTLSSFLLIGYKQDEISIRNSFRALLMNLFGGICFALGVYYLYVTTGVIELDKMMHLSKGLVLIPLVGLSLGGLTKSAQLPFSSWLVGAMVAPTPVSALLHSSAMVKAGVYLLIKLSALYVDTTVGVAVAGIGGMTFVLASFICISQSDAKRILAYSTIANLGLIVVCAGIGGYQALWAGILLIIFHAVAKGLLFLCVGVVEHKSGSRDVESMDGLVQAMPTVAWMMLIGMAGMFLAPFGMLISKWAVLIALVKFAPAYVIFILFGSSATLFFWVKWMGKILTMLQPRENIEGTVSLSEWTALYTLAFLTIAMCLLFPLVSTGVIEPYVLQVYGTTASLGAGNLMIMLIMMGLVVLFGLVHPLARRQKNLRITDAYLGGANAESCTAFVDSFGKSQEYTFSNYYFMNIFNEKELNNSGIVISWFVIVLMAASVIPWHLL
jgi:ech hydrogenase subunit A